MFANQSITPFFSVLCVCRLSVPQRVPGLSRCDSVCCLAGGSLWRLWLVSTQAGESQRAHQRENH